MLSTHIVFNVISGHIIGGYLASCSDEAISRAVTEGDLFDGNDLDTTDLEADLGDLDMFEAIEADNNH